MDEEMLRCPPMLLEELSPDGSTAPFWAAAREHRLVFPWCTECAIARAPLAPRCGKCGATTVEWRESVGRGTIFSFTIVRHAVTAHFRPYVPYAIIVVELDDVPGVRLLSNLVDCHPTDVSTRRPVELVWDDQAAWSLPRFRLQEAAG
jgi:uncharacterized OB-fold protein